MSLNLPIEIYFKIFDSINLEDLLILCEDPLYNTLLKSYYNLLNYKTYRSLLSLIYNNELQYIIIDINTILKILENKNYIIKKNNNCINISKGNIEIIYKENKVTNESWYKNGLLHRIEGPAIICWDNEKKIYEAWYKNNLLNREDGPAQTYWNANLQKTFEGWYINGLMHRLHSPAYIKYKEERKIEEKWLSNGKFYDGSSHVIWKGNKLSHEYFYKNNKKIKEKYYS